jgi:ribosomal protein S18 acetylase RimI-like enzyme
VSAVSELDVRPVDASRWADLASFFGPSGAYAGCWCTYFRRSGREFEDGCRGRGAGNREFLARLTREGAVPGLLAYDGGEPAGWVSVAPRPEFGRVLRSPILRPGLVAGDDPEDGSVWSLVCFWIPRARRGQGLGGALLDAAVSYAANAGGRVLEAYPVDTGGTKALASSLYTGTLPMFLRAGFEEVGRRSARRPIVRRRLAGRRR